MNRRLWGALAVVVVAAALIVAWRLRRGDETAQPAAPAQAAHATAPAPHAPAEARATAIVKVVDARGPIAGATVRLAGDDVVIATTGGDGVARLDGLAPGTWRIAASAADHAPAALPARELHAGETAQLEVKLEPGGRTLAGVVTDVSGGPIAGARVDAAQLGAGIARPGDAVASTATGADGHYKLAVASGQLLVAVSHGDYAPQSRYVDVGAAGATADFQLVPGGVIEGVVRDERSHQPVAGADVDAHRDAPTMLLGERARRRVKAGRDGTFRITGLRPGAYALEASGQGARTRAPTHVGLGVAEQVSDVTLLVAASAAVRGLVVDDSGAPVANATVSALDDENGTESDAHGAFVLDGLAPGHHDLIATADDFLPQAPTPVELGGHDVTGVRIAMMRGPRVNGHVEPRQVCDVSIEPSAHASAEMMVEQREPTTTGPDGAFELRGLVPQRSTIAARCPSGAEGSLEVDVAPGLGEVVIHVEPGASIAGRVVDAHGAPIASVIVNAAPQEGAEHTTIVNGVVTSGVQAMTDGAGAYELRGLAPGAYRLRVLDRGRMLPAHGKPPALQTVAAGEHRTGVELAVERADGVIRGTVTGPDGKPLADAWVSVQLDLMDMVASINPEPSDDGAGVHSQFVTIQSSGDGEDGAVSPVLTDASGAFELRGLARVPWTVVAEAQAGALRGRADHVTPDATVTITAGGVTSLHGTVHASAPLDSFTVELQGPTIAQRTFSSADGTFELDRIDPGTYDVRVTSSAGNGEASVQIAAGQAASVDITLASNAIVTGRVVDAGGKPMPGVPVAVVPDTGNGSLRVSLSGAPPTTGPDGAFRVEAKAGKSIVVALVQPMPAIHKVTLEAGQTIDVGAIAVGPEPPPKP
ncbi:MAG TPA: carboxypeptidase regulatory-like domain-containing protein [Kofleriaceae bacterium]|nr:carboxypeptidase regulatory-like domain-containing protein [Kofleriaceae bacterium]